MTTTTTSDEEFAPLVAVGGNSNDDGGVSPNIASCAAETEAESSSSPYRGYMRALSESYSHHVGKIGFLGSMSIAVNSLTGPAMLNIPDTFQRAGVIPTTLTVILGKFFENFNII